MRIISYNVNGIRAALSKGFEEWLQDASPDVLCLQETKAQPDQIDTEIFNRMGYTCYIHSAQKKDTAEWRYLQKFRPTMLSLGWIITNMIRKDAYSGPILMT